jgi:hypothetical protein
MELKKKSFILHVDSLDVLTDLSDEQAGKLFKAMLAFHKGEEIELDPLTKMAFSFFKNQFIRDNEKYVKTCEARAQAGSKGGKQKQQNIANASKRKQRVAEVADSDNESDSENDSDSKKDVKPSKAKPSDAKEVQDYFYERGFGQQGIGQKFIDHYDSIGWKRGKQPVKDWKATARTWMGKMQPTTQQPQQKQQSTFDALSELEKL